MVEVKKKDNESFESLMRRFNRRIQQSGIVMRTRNNRFRIREKSRNVQRKSAQVRAIMRQLSQEMKKYGKPVTEATKEMYRLKK